MLCSQISLIGYRQGLVVLGPCFEAFRISPPRAQPAGAGGCAGCWPPQEPDLRARSTWARPGLALDPPASFTDGFSLGSAWPAGETSQPLLVPQRSWPLCNPSQGLSVSICSNKFGVWTDLVGNGCWAGPWTTGIRRANTRIMILPALTHETNIR